MAAASGRYHRRAISSSEPALSTASLEQALPRRLALAAILVAAAALRLWRLDPAGFIVPYYFAGVRSMMQGWHNFWFNAFDPAGFLSLDKPPVAFWLQTLSADLFGFGMVGVLLPQAVEGVASAGLLYLIVRRHFGGVSGLLAALFLALTPVSLAVDRSNNTESSLVLVLLLATWAALRAFETGRTRYLLLCAAAVGIGFNVKMAVAIGVVPIFAAVYFAAAPVTLPRRIGRLALAGVVLAVVGLSWCLAYDLTPPDSRPFADSTRDNSMLQLAVGHNAAQRFDREASGFWANARGAPQTSQATRVRANSGYGNFVAAGPLRLVDPRLAGQVGWLLPLAIMGGIAAWLALGRGRPLKPGHAALAMWAGWTVAYAAVFSAAGGLFHAYYVAVLAPPLCALAGIGAVALFERARLGRAGWVWLATALFATALWQAYIEWGHANEAESHLYLVPLAAAAIAFAALWLLPPFGRAGMALGLAGLLVIPAAWDIAIAGSPGPNGFPQARPPRYDAERDQTRRFWAAATGERHADPKLLAYLLDQRRGERFVLATVSARQAAPVIIATGEPVVAMGGFSGAEPALGLDRFAKMVGDNQVRFALFDGQRDVTANRQPEILAWVQAHGRPVDPALWQTPRPEDLATAPRRRAQAHMELYDLRPVAVGAAAQ